MSKSVKLSSRDLARAILTPSESQNFKSRESAFSVRESQRPDSLSNEIRSIGALTYAKILIERRAFLTKEGRVELGCVWASGEKAWDVERFSAWRALTNATANTFCYSGYYQSLCENFNNLLLQTQNQIKKDIFRTRSMHSVELPPETGEAMFRILLAIAKRRMDMEYTQGMNFICLFFLDCGFQEEEVFWILVHIFEQVHFPAYYRDLTHFMGDCRLFKILLRQAYPKMYSLFEERNVDLTGLLLKQFLCLFTSVDNHIFRLIAMDLILLEGVSGVYRILLVCFGLFEKEIMDLKDPEEVLDFFNERLLCVINASLFRDTLIQCYVNKFMLQKARENYSEREISKNPLLPPKNASKQCIPGAPFCPCAALCSKYQKLPEVILAEKVLDPLIISLPSEPENQDGNLAEGQVEMKVIAKRRCQGVKLQQVNLRSRRTSIKPENPAEEQRPSDLQSLISEKENSGLIKSNEAEVDLNLSKSQAISSPGASKVGLVSTRTPEIRSREVSFIPILRKGEEHLLIFRNQHTCGLYPTRSREQETQRGLMMGVFGDADPSSGDHNSLRGKGFTIGSFTVLEVRERMSLSVGSRPRGKPVEDKPAPKKEAVLSRENSSNDVDFRVLREDLDELMFEGKRSFRSNMKSAIF